MMIGSIAAATVLFWTAAAVALHASWGVVHEFAHAATLAEIGVHPQSTNVYDRQGRPAFTFYVEQREDVPLDRVSPHMVHALLSVEDRRFYDHHGIDGVR